MKNPYTPGTVSHYLFTRFTRKRVPSYDALQREVRKRFGYLPSRDWLYHFRYQLKQEGYRVGTQPRRKA